MSDKTREEIARECPWCGYVGSANLKVRKNDSGDVNERRCSSCGKVLAAYLASEGNFFEKIRAYPNS